ncbi:MAG TPA: cupin domain-containing protein [Nitrososphaeraceae archaeon]|jgi:quercetin dioxygenase-like cupin family protein
MQKKSIVSTRQDSYEKYKDKFTGNFIIKDLLDINDSKEQEMYYVTFKDGCRTRPHLHASEQILIATEGRGIVVFPKRISIEPDDITKTEIEIEKTVILEKGDIICVPAFMLHWHGCVDSNEDFSHIAIRKRTDLENIWF